MEDIKIRALELALAHSRNAGTHLAAEVVEAAKVFETYLLSDDPKPPEAAPEA